MYQRPNQDFWSGRIDSNEGIAGYRWHQLIKDLDLSDELLPELKNDEIGIVFLGFKSDEGVRRNKGRIGAKDGPDTLRVSCSNLADHFEGKTTLIEGGNIICEGRDLEKAQEELSFFINKILSSKYFPMVFGGGHEVAYPHYMGIRKSVPETQSIGIINIDAHFDLRIPDKSSSSGTPFYEISLECNEASSPFKYLCLGVQKSGNTRALFKRAEEFGVKFVFAHELANQDSSKITQLLKEFISSVDHIYLTICLDAFDISFAPGVSAPSAMGLEPYSALKIIREVKTSGKLISADIAELNPRLDQNRMTARLGAKLTFHLLSDL